MRGELLIHADGPGHVPADVPDPPDDDGTDAPRYALSVIPRCMRIAFGCIVLVATVAGAAPASAATVGVEQRGEACGKFSCAEFVQVVVISDAGPSRIA